MIDQETINKIRELPIQEFVSEYVPTLKLKGRDFWACCPFHSEKSPSFKVNTQRNTFKCFGCGKGGDIIAFAQEIERVEFVDAVNLIGKHFHLEIPQFTGNAPTHSLYDILEEYAAHYHETLFMHPEAIKYLMEDRKLSMQTILDLRIGLCDAKGIDDSRKDAVEAAGIVQVNEQGRRYDTFFGRIVFPIKDITGRVAGFSGRIWTESQAISKLPKYKNSPASPLYQKSYIVYGLWENRGAVREGKKALLVEGQVDVAGLMTAGIRNVVAGTGTAISADQIKLVKRYADDIVIMYDGDRAGISATLKATEVCLQCGVMPCVIALPEGHDPDSFRKVDDIHSLKEKLFPDYYHDLYQQIPLDDPKRRANAIKILAGILAHITDAIDYHAWLDYSANLFNLEKVMLIPPGTMKKKTVVEPNPQEAEFKKNEEYQLLKLVLNYRDHPVQLLDDDELIDTTFENALHLQFGHLESVPMTNLYFDTVRQAEWKGEDIGYYLKNEIYASIFENVPPFDFQAAMKVAALFSFNHLTRLCTQAIEENKYQHIPTLTSLKHATQNILRRRNGKEPYRLLDLG